MPFADGAQEVADEFDLSTHIHVGLIVGFSCLIAIAAASRMILDRAHGGVEASFASVTIVDQPDAAPSPSESRQPHGSQAATTEPVPPASLVYAKPADPTPVAASAVAAPASDRIAEIERLAALLDRGMLSQEEFGHEKQRLLGTGP